MTANDLPTTPPATLRARGNEGLLAAAQAAHVARKVAADLAVAEAIRAERAAWLEANAWTRISLLNGAREALRAARREQLAASIAEAP